MAFDIETADADLDAALRAMCFGLRACVYNAANLTTINLTAGTYYVPWDTELYDVGGWHDGVNTTRLTVPSGLGITRVDIECFVSLSNVDASRGFDFVLRRNGATVLDGSLGVAGRLINDNNDTTPKLSYRCIDIPVSDGDYFEMRPTLELDSSVTIIGAAGSATQYSYFKIRAAEYV